MIFTKAQKHVELNIDYVKDNQCTKNKIFPLKIIRKSLPNCKNLRTRLAIEGHKYFSKFIASGEETEAILKKLNRTKTLKLIHYFEFDPYFCEKSCIKPLRKIMPRLKETREINLIIRRVDIPNETNVLYPSLYKILRLNKLRLAFPSTYGIDDAGFIKMAQIIIKCRSVRSLSYEFLDVTGCIAKCETWFTEAQRRLVHLKEFKLHLISMKSVQDNFAFVSQHHFKPNRSFKTEKLDLCLGFVGEWSVKSGDVDLTVEELASVLVQLVNLKEIRIKMFRHPVDSEIIMRLLEVFSNLKQIDHLSFDFLGVPFSEMEAMSFAYGLSKMHNLKKLTLKIVKKPDLPEDCINRLAIIVSKIPNLESFDLYFRKLDFPEEALKQLAEDLSKEACNVNCGCFKNSLHVKR